MFDEYRQTLDDTAKAIFDETLDLEKYIDDTAAPNSLHEDQFIEQDLPSPPRQPRTLTPEPILMMPPSPPASPPPIVTTRVKDFSPRALEIETDEMRQQRSFWISDIREDSKELNEPVPSRAELHALKYEELKRMANDLKSDVRAKQNIDIARKTLCLFAASIALPGDLLQTFLKYEKPVSLLSWVQKYATRVSGRHAPVDSYLKSILCRWYPDRAVPAELGLLYDVAYDLYDYFGSEQKRLVADIEKRKKETQAMQEQFKQELLQGLQMKPAAVAPLVPSKVAEAPPPPPVTTLLERDPSSASDNESHSTFRQVKNRKTRTKKEPIPELGELTK